MNQSRSAALRSSSAKKKVNIGKGRFASILDQRKTNLEQQREKLEMAKLKLREDQMLLDEEMKKLQGQQDLIQEIENDIRNLDHSTSILTEDITCSALRHQMTVLQKTEADLTQQLRIAQQQLDEKTYKLKVSNNKNENPEKIRLLENELKEKAIQFRMIRELLETLKTEILTRENDVILLEFNALEHKKELDKSYKERETLIKRKQDAEISKINIVHEIKKNDQIKLEYSEKKKSLETKLESIQSEKDRLDNLEKELNEKENQLKKKQDQFLKMQNELDQIRLNKVKEDINKQADLEDKIMKDRRNSSQLIDTQSEDNVNIEIQLDTDEKLIRMRTFNYKTEQDTQNQMYNEKRQKMIEMIDQLQQYLENVEKRENIEGEISKANDENEKVKEDIKSLEEEINEIKSKILSEEEMKRVVAENQNEIKKLLKEESEIRTTLLDLKGDERELQEYEEEISQKMSELDNERYLYQKKGIAIQQELQICETRIADVKKKYQIAYNNYLQNKKNK